MSVSDAQVVAKLEELQATVERQEQQLRNERAEAGRARTEAKRLQDVEAEAKRLRRSLNEALAASGASREEANRKHAELVASEAENAVLRERLEVFEAAAHAERRKDELVAGL